MTLIEQEQFMDPMRQAFNELFGPLFDGKPIFLEINSAYPSTEIGPFFENLKKMGIDNGFKTILIDIPSWMANDSETTHKRFVTELIFLKKQADKQPMLLLIRRFSTLKQENYEIYKNLFLKLIKAKKPVGVIIQTIGHPFIVSTALTNLGRVQPRIIDIHKVISPRNSSYIPR